MSVILSMQTFNKLEEKLGTDSAKQVYQLAEAIYEEIEKKTEDKLKNYKVDFADEEYKRLTRKELNDFKTELIERQKTNKDEFVEAFKSLLRKVNITVNSLLAISLLNLVVMLFILYSILTG